MQSNRISFISTIALAGVMLTACQQQPATPPADTPEVLAAAEAFVAYQMPSTTDGGSCSFDTVDGQPADGVSIKVGSVARLRGWVGDAQGQVPAHALFVLSNAEGAYSLPLVAGQERPDVAAAFNNPTLAKAGFDVPGNFKDVKAGTYSAAIVFDGTPAVVCQLQRTISVDQ